MVIRDMSFCSVAPTASDSMLKPRRENSDATRASTPGLSSTSTDRVCVASCCWCHQACPSFGIVEQRADSAGGLDLVIAGARGHHRPHLRVGADDEVDHHRAVVDRPRLVDHVVDVFVTLATQSDAAQRLGQLDEVRDAARVRGQIGLAVPLLVEQRLPLPHHAQVAVVDQRDLDRRALDRAGGQLLIGHLEAAVAVDRPHLGVGAGRTWRPWPPERRSPWCPDRRS